MNDVWIVHWRSLHHNQWDSQRKSCFGLCWKTARFTGLFGHHAVDAPVFPELLVKPFGERTLHRADVRPWHSKLQGTFQGIRFRRYPHVPLATRSSFVLQKNGQVLHTGRQKYPTSPIHRLRGGFTHGFAENGRIRASRRRPLVPQIGNLDLFGKLHQLRRNRSRKRMSGVHDGPGTGTL